MTEVGAIHPITGQPMGRCPGCGTWSGLSGIDGGLCLSCSNPVSCLECGEGWPDEEPKCPACGLTVEQVAEKVAGESRRYGPGNPDWERDIEREYERG